MKNARGRYCPTERELDFIELNPLTPSYSFDGRLFVQPDSRRPDPVETLLAIGGLGAFLIIFLPAFVTILAVV